MKGAVHVIDQIEELATAQADLSKVKVSRKSYVYDVIWDFTGDLAHRPRSVGDTKLTVNWSKYSFSPALCRELQKIFALYYKAPRALGGRRTVKANTLCAKIHHTLNFLEYVVARSGLPDAIEGLYQLKWMDIKEAASTYPGRSISDLQKGLKVLFATQVGKILGHPLSLSLAEIKRIEFKAQSERCGRKLNETPQGFSDALFSFLSDAATARVYDFLTRMNMSPEDKVSRKYHAPGIIEQVHDFPATFHVYECLRRKRKKVPICNELEHILRARVTEAGITAVAMRDYLTEINTAAQCVIALYTGARYSEFVSLEVGCLEDRDGVPCVAGRVFKTKNDALCSDDAWVAIPAVRDAVRVLERLAVIKNRRYLISSLETANGEGPKGQGLSYTGAGFRDALDKLLRSVDKEARFQGWRFNTHQFRHSLARQMVMAKLGLPYISFQLKHLYSRVVSLPSDVTLGYGNAANLLQSEMAGIRLKEIQRDITRQICDPDSVITGGAAAEFDARRKDYFEGMTGAGMTKEQIIDGLASTSSPMFVNVGLGYCTGRKSDPSTGESPPCIGSLRCNPARCGNAIITPAHAGNWRKVMLENRRMLGDVRFSYANAELEVAAEEAELVLRHLGQEVADE